MADYSPPASHPIIKIGPRGGLIVGQRTGKDGKPEYDYQRPEHQHIGAGPHREAPYRRPVQQSLFDAPRTLALKPPEEPRRRAAEKPQGDLFGAVRTVAVANPAPPSGSRVAKLAKPLPWAAVQHHEPEPAPAPAPKAEWKAPEPTPAAAKLEGQTRERNPDSPAKPAGLSPDFLARRAKYENLPMAELRQLWLNAENEPAPFGMTKRELAHALVVSENFAAKDDRVRPAKPAVLLSVRDTNEIAHLAAVVQSMLGDVGPGDRARADEIGGEANQIDIRLSEGKIQADDATAAIERLKVLRREIRGLVDDHRAKQPPMLNGAGQDWLRGKMRPGEDWDDALRRVGHEIPDTHASEEKRRQIKEWAERTKPAPARVNPDEVTAAEQRQRQEAAEESARRRRKPEEAEAPKPTPADKLDEQTQARQEATVGREAEKEAADETEADTQAGDDGGKGGPKTALVQTRHLERFAKAIEALNKRARRLGVPELKWEEVPGSRRVETEHHEQETKEKTYRVTVARQVCEVRLLGDPPKLNGWQFIAKVKQIPTGSWIFKTAAGEDVPLNIRKREHHKDCDHCKVKRGRTEGYVVRKDTTGEYKTIGSSCVMDFLGGHDPAGMMNALTIWAEANRLLENMRAADREEGGFEFGGGKLPMQTTLKHFLGHVAASVRRNGWVSRQAAQESTEFNPKTSTAEDALSTTFPSKGLLEANDNGTFEIEPQLGDKKLAEEAHAWAKKKYGDADPDTLDTFGHNLRTIINDDFVDPKLAGMAAWLLRGHLQEIGQGQAKKRAEAAGHFGTLKERTESDVKVTDLKQYESYEYGPGYIVSMETPDGHRLKWFTGSPPSDFQIGATMHVKLTPKKHDNYKGQPETRVSNVALMGPAHSEGGGPIAYRPPGTRKTVLLPRLKPGVTREALEELRDQRAATFEQRVAALTEAGAKKREQEYGQWRKTKPLTDEEREQYRRSAEYEARSQVGSEDMAAATKAANESGARMFEKDTHEGVHFISLQPGAGRGEVEGGIWRIVGPGQREGSISAVPVDRPDDKPSYFSVKHWPLVVVGHDPSAEPPPKAKKPRTVGVAAT